MCFQYWVRRKRRWSCNHLRCSGRSTEHLLQHIVWRHTHSPNDSSVYVSHTGNFLMKPKGSKRRAWYEINRRSAHDSGDCYCPYIHLLLLPRSHLGLPVDINLSVHPVTLNVLVMGEAQKMPRNFLRCWGSRLSSSSLVIVLMLSWYLSAAASYRASAASALCRNSLTVTVTLGFHFG